MAFQRKASEPRDVRFETKFPNAPRDTSELTTWIGDLVKTLNSDQQTIEDAFAALKRQIAAMDSSAQFAAVLERIALLEALPRYTPVEPAEPVVVDIGIHVSEDEKFALRGTFGHPSISNRYVTSDDPRLVHGPSITINPHVGYVPVKSGSLSFDDSPMQVFTSVGSATVQTGNPGEGRALFTATTNYASYSVIGSDGSGGNLVAGLGVALTLSGVGGITGVILQPSASDSTTPFVFNSLYAHSSGYLLEVQNDELSELSITPTGGIFVGHNTALSALLPSLPNYMTFASIRSSDLGDPPIQIFYLAQATTDTTPMSSVLVTAQTTQATFSITEDDGSDAMSFAAQVSATVGELLIQYNADILWKAEPTFNDGPGEAYRLDTLNALTNASGARLLAALNAGADKFVVLPDSGYSGTGLKYFRDNGTFDTLFDIVPTWTGLHTWNRGSGSIALRLSTSATATSNTPHETSAVMKFRGSIWNGASADLKEGFIHLQGREGMDAAHYLTLGTDDSGAVLALTSAGSMVLGPWPWAAIATTATDGFIYIPSCAGVPTGVPTQFGSTVPLVFDRTNNDLYIYNSGWKKTTTFA